MTNSIAEYYAECFYYYSSRGTLTWRSRPAPHFATERGHRIFNSKYAGKTAGVSANGYIQVRLGGQLLYAHRIAWMIASRCDIPDGYVLDHRNGDGCDNRLANLRLATSSENNRNQRQKPTRDLPKGVFCDKSRDCFVGYVTLNKRQHFAGRFDTIAETAAAVQALRSRLHGDFTNHGAANAP